MKGKGVKVVGVDLKGPKEDLERAIAGIDIVISAVNYQGLKDQIPLVDAAKKAGVKRFIPCHFATVCAPRGVMSLHDVASDNPLQRQYWTGTQLTVKEERGRSRPHQEIRSTVHRY